MNQRLTWARTGDQIQALPQTQFDAHPRRLATSIADIESILWIRNIAISQLYSLFSVLFD
jgi:hypothetical protein